MFKTIRSADFLRCAISSRATWTAACTAVLFAGVAMMGAQTVSQAANQADAQGPAAAQARQPLSVQTPAIDTADDALFSSSSAENNVANDQAASDTAGTHTLASLHPMPFKFADMQYGGGRRRYGSPRYRGGNTNADGSSKYIFFGGGGFSQTVGNTFKYLTPSWGFQVGGGRQFSKHFAVPIEFDYDHFGFTRQNISDESCIYTYSGAGAVSNSTCDFNAADNGIDANSHIWSFSVDPTVNVVSGDTWGAYVVAGAGFYHKVANFTAPQDEEFCYFYCETGEVQSNFDHYTSNAPGFSGGFGLTYKFSHFSNERLYGEVRYVFVDNSQRTGYTVQNIGTTSYNGYDAYPANSNRTTYIPVKFGIRF